MPPSRSDARRPASKRSRTSAGAYAATGHYRSGILLAPVTGVLITEMILQKPSTLPLEPFAVGRAAGSA